MYFLMAYARPWQVHTALINVEIYYHLFSVLSVVQGSVGHGTQYKISVYLKQYK